MAISSNSAQARWPSNLPTYTAGDGFKYGLMGGGTVGGIAALATVASRSGGSTLASRLPKAASNFGWVTAGVATAATGQAATYEFLRNRGMGEKAADAASSGLVAGLAGAGLLAAKGRGPGFAKTGLVAAAVTGALWLASSLLMAATSDRPPKPSESARSKYGS